jgi:hypothetical protein
VRVGTLPLVLFSNGQVQTHGGLYSPNLPGTSDKRDISRPRRQPPPTEAMNPTDEPTAIPAITNTVTREHHQCLGHYRSSFTPLGSPTAQEISTCAPGTCPGQLQDCAPERIQTFGNPSMVSAPGYQRTCPLSCGSGSLLRYRVESCLQKSTIPCVGDRSSVAKKC